MSAIRMGAKTAARRSISIPAQNVKPFVVTAAVMHGGTVGVNIPGRNTGYFVSAAAVNSRVTKTESTADVIVTYAAGMGRACHEH